MISSIDDSFSLLNHIVNGFQKCAYIQIQTNHANDNYNLPGFLACFHSLVPITAKYFMIFIDDSFMIYKKILFINRSAILP